MDADSDFEPEGRGGRIEKEKECEMDLRAAEKLCWPWPCAAFSAQFFISHPCVFAFICG
jgi:hypothetical protein